MDGVASNKTVHPKGKYEEQMFTSGFGTYVDGLFGIGADRPYDWGVGVGARFKY